MSKFVLELFWIGIISLISSIIFVSYFEFGLELFIISMMIFWELLLYIIIWCSVSYCKEKLINLNFDVGYIFFNGVCFSSSSLVLWIGFFFGFLNLWKKRMFVFWLGRFLVCKFRIGVMWRGFGYDKFSNNNFVIEIVRKKKFGYLKFVVWSLLKGVKVLDDLEGEWEIFVVEVDWEDL